MSSNLYCSGLINQFVVEKEKTTLQTHLDSAQKLHRSNRCLLSLIICVDYSVRIAYILIAYLDIKYQVQSEILPCEDTEAGLLSLDLLSSCLHSLLMG